MAEPDRARDDGASERDQVFYDATCRLCVAAARFVDRQDRRPRLFRLTPLASEAFERLVPDDRRADLPDSLVLRATDGRLLTRSTAVAHILIRLGGLWCLLGRLLQRVPAPARDLVYDLVARLRRRLPPLRPPTDEGTAPR
jgi:predicted DCC family thiol-disulfide oxidoreductase YuxK